MHWVPAVVVVAGSVDLTTDLGRSVQVPKGGGLDWAIPRTLVGISGY